MTWVLKCVCHLERVTEALELDAMKQENEQLEIRFNRFKDTAKLGNITERVLSLETELSEAMESNAMYKMQLRK